MKHQKQFMRIISVLLTLAMLCGLVPTMAFAAMQDTAEVVEEDFPTDVVDAVADPMLGMQSGVEDLVQTQGPRTLEQLVTLNGVTLTEDGQLASVKTSLLNTLSEEEQSLLLSLMTATTYSTCATGPNEELKEQFGLTDDEIERGVRLHGDMLAFTSELSDLAINQKHMTISDQQMKELVQLIAAGYTCSQAILALAATDTLGLSLEALKAARVAEREEELLAVAEENASSEEPEVDVSDYLAEKTGLPKTLVEQLLGSGDTTAYQIDRAMEGALSRAYPRPSKETGGEEVALLADSNNRTLYDPKEVLGKPYTYDQQGNFDVNLSNGSYSYSETDLSIPGKNGLDLVLTRQYHSDQARTTYSLGAIDSEIGYQYDISNETAFVVHCKWYEVKNDGTVIRELTDPSKYTLTDSAGNSRARNSKKFSLGEYYSALAYLNGERKYFLGSQYAAEDAKGDGYSVTIIPTITGMPDIVEEYLEIMEFEDSYLVDEFGLGHGWMLGISHLRKEYPGYGDINEDERQLRLTTSEGTQYYIERNIGTSGNYIEDYDGNDIMFHKCSSGEYPNAVYGLYHKDGKVEYFDSNGRNIAIVDRFGNKITLAYTFEDTKQKQVSKIEITDTVNNTVVYEKVTLDPDIDYKIEKKSYNGKWRLLLNDQVVREYYTDTASWTLYSVPQSDGSTVDHDTSPVKLVGTTNEQGEFTYYTSNTRKTRFNCFLQPAVRKTLSQGKPLYANDGYQMIVDMYKATLPNKATNGITLELSQETFGDYGYRSYSRCKSIEPASSAGISSSIVRYQWGDFDYMDGTRAWEDSYNTTAKYGQKYLFMKADGTMPGSGAAYENYDIKYTFNPYGQLVNVQKDSHHALDRLQEYIPEGYDWATNDKITWKAETIAYSYGSVDARKPSCITTTRFNESGTKTMTGSESYTYDDKWNIRTYTKPNGSKETYTYDTVYNLPLTQTVQQDSSTTIKVTNTLTADKKSIAASNVTRGTTAVGKTTFNYNSTGQLISQNDYLSSSNYVTTTYEYGGEALPTNVSVSDVKTADGTLVAGTPGLAAGTVACAQTYNDRGWITSQTDAKGKTTSYQYDAVGRITKVTNPDGTTQNYSYNVPNNTVTYTDEAGSQWLCTYGASGKLLTVKDLQSNRVLEENTYDHLDHLLRKVSYGYITPNQITYYRYDTDGRVIEQGNLDTNGNKLYQELYEYQDGSGKVTKTIVGDSNAPSIVTTSYQDNMGNVVKTGRFLNGTEYFDTFAYDYLGNQTQAKSAYNASLSDAYSTKTTYDHAGRVLTTTNILGQKASKTYDWLGNQLTDTDPKGNVTRYTYDVLGRLVRVVAPLDSGRTSQTDYLYDPNGNIIEERVRTGSSASSTTVRVTTYEYDDMGRVVLVKGNGKEDGQSGDDQFQYTQYTYDKLGNITKMYTGLHAPLTIDSDGNVTSNGDSDYAVTQYSYDQFSRLTQQTDALGQSVYYSYDQNGNLTSKTNRNGITIYNDYDAMGRLKCSQAGSDYIEFTYTATGQRKTASSNDQTNSYVYDELGRLVQETTPYATKTYAYNIGDLRTNFTVQNGDQTYLNNTYTYDKIGRLKTVNGSNAQATYNYDTNGNLSSTAYNNSTTATYTYNYANLPTQVLNKKGSTTRSRYTYTYGLDGNQLTKTDHLGRKTTYTYDGLNRLTQEAQTGTGAFTNSYTYDDYGNRSDTVLGEYSATYNYDLNNRLLSMTHGFNSATYTYDNQGNMTRNVSVNSTFEQTALNCTYDNFDRLIKASDNSGETVYTYDADGHRVSKTKKGVSEEYIWDGDQLVVTLGTEKIAQFTLPTSSGATVSLPKLIAGRTYGITVKGVSYTAVARTVKGESIPPIELTSSRARVDDTEKPEIPPVTEKDRILLEFGPVTMEMEDVEIPTENGLINIYVLGPANTAITLYDGDPALMTTSYVRGLSLVAAVQDGTRTYYHYNAHGDVVQLTNSSGTVTKDYAYDAFGVEQAVASGDANPFRYCGEQYDAETGNYYLRARYYSPGIGRFTQEDTHWNPGNMIYGDEPQKWNEWQGEENTLGLYTYTYKPEATAVAQAGNLYVYAVGNPAMYADTNGFWVGGAGGSISGGFIGYTSASKIVVFDGNGNCIELLTGTVGGGTPSASYGAFGTWSSASNVFEYANGISFSAGGSGGAATVSISGEFNMGKQTNGSMFAGGSFGASWSPSNLVVPIEGHAGMSTSKITQILLYNGKPLPKNVTIDYFSDLPYEIQQKIANDLNLKQSQKQKQGKQLSSLNKAKSTKQFRKSK